MIILRIEVSVRIVDTGTLREDNPAHVPAFVHAHFQGTPGVIYTDLLFPGLENFAVFRKHFTRAFQAVKLHAVCPAPLRIASTIDGNIAAAYNYHIPFDLFSGCAKESDKYDTAT